MGRNGGCKGGSREFNSARFLAEVARLLERLACRARTPASQEHPRHRCHQAQRAEHPGPGTKTRATAPDHEEEIVSVPSSRPAVK